MLIILALRRPRQDNHGLVWARLAFWAIARLCLKISKSHKIETFWFITIALKFLGKLYPKFNCFYFLQVATL